MAIVCIPKSVANKLKEALKTKDITVGQLLSMSPQERTAFFEKYVGKDAKDVELLFEKKLVLKNVYVGLKNFIDKIAGTGRYSDAKIEELKKSKAEFDKLVEERVLNPKDGETFLQELANEIAGEEITEEQAKELFKLQTASDKLYEERTEVDGKGVWSSEEAKADAGAARVEVENFTNYLSNNGLNLKGMFLERMERFSTEWKEGKTRSVVNLLTDSLKFISDNSIAMVASFDNSFMGMQGWKTLMTNPSKWWKEDVIGSFSDMAKVLGGENARDGLWADIYTRDNYLNGNYEKSGIIPKWEEQYPSSLPENIPVLGRFFKASEQAFTGSAIRSRTALFDMWLEKAQENGVTIDDKQIKDIGKLVSSLTSRGQWGKKGEPAIVKMFLWAPKMIKANIDVLTGMQLTDVGGYARKEAAKNLLKIVGETALLMMIANAIKPGSAEDDPRSSDFGKIVVGNTRFDITGGAASIVTLASRIASNSYKSTTSGEIIRYGTGYGDQDRWDAFMNFLTGKTTPPARMAIDLMKGENFKGDKVTIPSAIMSLTTPISIQNVYELKDDSSANAVLGAILDVIGINANTYSPYKANWSANEGVSYQAFREKVGAKKEEEASKKFDEEFNQWYEAVKQDLRFQNLEANVKQNVVSNKKKELTEKIMRQYGFVYKRAKATKTPKF